MTDAVCVFCGSSPGSRPEYMQAAVDIGSALAKSTSWKLVYGGGNRGCMGAVSSSCLEAGGKVLGVIPETMINSTPKGHPTSREGQGPEILAEDSNGNLETHVVQDMHTRKQMMAKHSNLGFVGLPGGYGTFEEVFEMITWTQLGIHRKPIILVNVASFFEPLRALVDKAVEDGFIPAHGKGILSFVDEKDAAEHGGWGKAMIAKVMEANQSMANSKSSGYFDWSNRKQGSSHRPASIFDTPAEHLSVDVKDLTFSFAGAEGPPALDKCNLSFTRGSRCLLIGANGAGKSTILRLLAGKRMPSKGAHIRVFGKDVFYESAGGVTYLGTEWAMNPVVRSDIKVSAFLDSVGGYRHKQRRDQLLDILDVDLNWRMHAISDGERRRVQLTMGLMEPWSLLLLDEVTVDLDVQVRADLLSFLAHETDTRGATIIYATHIFDGLQNFPTHLVHMRGGKTTTKTPVAWPPEENNDELLAALPQVDTVDKQHNSSLLFHTALAWLRDDRRIRAEDENKTGKSRRGANKSTTETDSERFFSKYDYSQGQTR